MDPEIVTIAVSMLALAGTAYTVSAQRRTAREQLRTNDAAQRVQEAAGAINGYNLLCQEQRAEIQRLNDEIATVRARMARMEAQHDQDRAEWAAEREQLEERIHELETERDRRQRLLDELQTKEATR
jgi:TolA-binding protein